MYSSSSRGLVRPRVIPNVPGLGGVWKVDWHSSGLIAFSSASNAYVGDPGYSPVPGLDIGSSKGEYQILCSLLDHEHEISIVRWCPYSSLLEYCKRGRSTLLLVTADVSSTVFVWDALHSTPLLRCPSLPKSMGSIVDMLWLHESTSTFLILSERGIVCIDILSKSKCWELEFSNRGKFVKIESDPFHPSRAVLTDSSGKVTIVSHLTAEMEPRMEELDFHLSLSSKSETQVNRKLLSSRFSPHLENSLFVMTSHQILLVDTVLGKQLCQIAMHTYRSSFAGIFFDPQDATILYTSHEDGSICVWKSKTLAHLDFDFILQTEPVKPTFSPSSDVVGVGVAQDPNRPWRFVSLSAFGQQTIWSWLDRSRSPEGTDQSTPYRWVLESVLSCIDQNIRCSSLSPEGSMVALGSSKGNIQVFDLSSGNCLREFFVFDSPIRSIRWRSQSSFLVCGWKEAGEGIYSNIAGYIDLSSGAIQLFRNLPVPEPSYIRGIRCSPCGMWIALFFSERPIEIWNLKNRKLHSIIPSAAVSALEWFSSSKGEPLSSTDAQLCFASSDGSLHVYHLASHRTGIIMSPSWSGSVTSLCWRDQFLVVGFANGDVYWKHMGTLHERTISMYSSSIVRLGFSPASRSALLLVRAEDGSFGVWDIEEGVQITDSISERRRLLAIDVDWAPHNMLFASLRSGTVAIFDINLSCCNCPYYDYSFPVLINCPALLPLPASVALKVSLEFGSRNYIFPPPGLSSDVQFSESETGDDFPTPRILEKFNYPAFFVHAEELLAAGSLSDVYIFTSKLYSDRFGEHLYNTFVASMEYLRNGDSLLFRSARRVADICRSVGLEYQSFESIINTPASLSRDEIRNSGLEVNVPEFISSDTSSNWKGSLGHAPPYLSILRSKSDHLQAIENRAARERFSVSSAHSTHSSSEFRAGSASIDDSSYLSMIAMHHSVSGDNEGAVRTLLATPVEAESFLLNGLKACLTASVRTPEHFMFAIKLVATNLVACGKLQDAVEILCFAGCFDDACRFLQVHDRWEAAASLGKATLDDESYRVLIDRWADILCEGQASEWEKAALLFLSIGEISLCLWTLFRMGAFEHMIGLFRCLQSHHMEISPLAVALIQVGSASLHERWMRLSENHPGVRLCHKRIQDDILRCNVSSVVNENSPQVSPRSIDHLSNALAAYGISDEEDAGDSHDDDGDN